MRRARAQEEEKEAAKVRPGLAHKTNVLAAKARAHRRHPIVLVPGLGASILHVKASAEMDPDLGQRIWVAVARGDEYSRLLGAFHGESCRTEPLLPVGSPRGVLNPGELSIERACRPPQGLEVFVPSLGPEVDPGGLFPVDNLDPGMLLPVAAVEYFRPLIRYLEERGYQRGKTLFVSLACGRGSPQQWSYLDGSMCVN